MRESADLLVCSETSGQSMKSFCHFFSLKLFRLLYSLLQLNFWEHENSIFGWNLIEFNTKNHSATCLWQYFFLELQPLLPLYARGLFISLSLRLACSHLLPHCLAITVFFLLCLRTFCRRSSGSNSGPVEVQLSREPPDGSIRGQAEPAPGPSPLSPSTTTCGPRKRMQPELPHRHRQVLWRTLWRWWGGSF